jgi:hypothetical protein
MLANSHSSRLQILLLLFYCLRTTNTRRFSVGIDETARLYEQQHRLKESGYPYYDKLSKGIGRTEAVQVWVRKTIDADDFLTQLELSHSDPANALHKVTHYSIL